MNTGKIYFNSNGEERSIWQMLRDEPNWVASRLQEGEYAIEQLKELRAERNPQQHMVRLPSTLTAENGAKGLLIGDFNETLIISCNECDGEGFHDEECSEICECCDGNGEVVYSVPVQWTTIKDIYKKIVEHLAT